MQIMEGDLIRTIETHSSLINHYHTAGVPGRADLDADQEINYPAVLRAIIRTGYTDLSVTSSFRRVNLLAALKAAFDVANL